ncbi:MAG: CoA transferase [Dehalococcoidia bacterium]
MALDGLKVIDASSHAAGPLVATFLADFGADVIKVEHPQGDSLRTLGWQKDGTSLWWYHVNRNKRCITLNLSLPRGQELFKELVSDADVVIENFRTGTLERWGIGYDTLSALNPRLILLCVTGFGQTGPYRSRPGFGTVAESMSGFAHLTGQPDGPPTLPSFALGDSVCALVGTYATMFALYHRDIKGAGEGQVIDLALYEGLFSILGPQALLFDQLGIELGRTGSRMPFAAPRNVYRAKDGRWLGLAAGSQASANRVMFAIGRDDVTREPWFQSMPGRLANQDELDAIIGAWIAEHTAEEVIEAFAQFEGVVAPIYTIADTFADPQFQARQNIVAIDDPHLGTAHTQNVAPRMSKTPGRLRHLGADLGAHNHEIYVEQLGYAEADLAAWKTEGVI